MLADQEGQDPQFRQNGQDLFRSGVIGLPVQSLLSPGLDDGRGFYAPVETTPEDPTPLRQTAPDRLSGLKGYSDTPPALMTMARVLLRLTRTRLLNWQFTLNNVRIVSKRRDIIAVCTGAIGTFKV